MTDTNLYSEPNPGATDATSPPATPAARPKDPRIAPLHALFPDYDDLILYSVLDSVNGDQDRAIDALLGMSDPDYRGEPAAPLQPALSQTELDEQFARRLLLEEQDAQQAAWIAQQQEMPTRHRYPHPGQDSSTDTMADIQQQFGKFAETGKKTFNSILNKVKAKIQDIDQPKTTQSSTYDPQNQPSPSQLPYAARPRTRAPAPVQQPAYYDPNPPPASPPAQMQGYDTTPAPMVQSSAAIPPASSSTTPPLIDTQQRSLTSPPIDGGKYGLLPKRPVTLLRPAEPTQMQRQHSLDDSDDGLEYAENPFEDGKK